MGLKKNLNKPYLLAALRSESDTALWSQLKNRIDLTELGSGN